MQIENMEPGQMRIPKNIAIEKHIAQYSTRSMLEQEARANTIRAIVNALGISEQNVPWHDRDEVNLTLMMVDDGRSDLAKILWTKPEAFKTEHTELVKLGLQRVEVILNHQQQWESGKETINKRKSELEKVEMPSD